MSLDNIVSLCSRIALLAYTRWIRLRLRECGAHSRIGFPVTINCGSAIALGQGVTIREHAWLNANAGAITDKNVRARLQIGDGAYIGRFCHINACREIIIEPKVLISDRVYISDADHCHADRLRPIMDQGIVFKGSVVLKSGCWIGIGAVILPGVRIGRNAIVAANAVVKQDVPDNVIAGGIPARVLLRRSSEHQ